MSNADPGYHFQIGDRVHKEPEGWGTIQSVEHDHCADSGDCTAMAVLWDCGDVTHVLAADCDR